MSLIKIVVMLFFGNMVIGSHIDLNGYHLGPDGFLYYKYHKNKKSWTAANETCNNEGGHLVMEHRKATHDYIISKWDQRFWIGVYDKDGKGDFTFVDGSNLVDTYWATGEPNHLGKEKCGEMNHPGHPHGTWNNMPCSWSLEFLCQKELSLERLLRQAAEGPGRSFLIDIGEELYIKTKTAATVDDQSLADLESLNAEHYKLIPVNEWVEKHKEELIQTLRRKFFRNGANPYIRDPRSALITYQTGGGMRGIVAVNGKEFMYVRSNQNRKTIAQAKRECRQIGWDWHLAWGLTRADVDALGKILTVRSELGIDYFVGGIEAKILLDLRTGRALHVLSYNWLRGGRTIAPDMWAENMDTVQPSSDPQRTVFSLIFSPKDGHTGLVKRCCSVESRLQKLPGYICRRQR